MSLFLDRSKLLVNPNRAIRPDIASKLKPFKKFACAWARKLQADQQVETLEGTESAYAGDYLCRGVAGELWPQSQTTFLTKYDPTGLFDGQWQKFETKPNTTPVLAASLDYSFTVNSDRGTMNGKAGDYVVANFNDGNDVWIVDREIFESTYKNFQEDSDLDD